MSGDANSSTTNASDDDDKPGGEKMKNICSNNNNNNNLNSNNIKEEGEDVGVAEVEENSTVANTTAPTTSNSNTVATTTTFVQPPCGQRGTCTFYKSFSYSLPNNRADSPQQKNLTLGEFFFVRIAPCEICIAELQLLWRDSNREESLSSSRLYFLPLTTKDVAADQYGQDEVLAMSEKVVLRLEDLITWMTTDVRWDRRRQALVHHRNNASVNNNNHHRYRNNNHRHNNDHNTNNKNSKNSDKSECSNNSRNNNNNSDDEKVDKLTASGKGLEDTTKCSRAIGSKLKEGSSVDRASPSSAEGPASVTVLSYPRYCRYRAILKRLEDVTDSWVKNSIVQLLGGFDCPDVRNHRVVFCRDTLDRPDIEQDEHLCNHLAPNLKGRPRKKRLKTSRGHSPSSESNTSEEASGPSCREVVTMPTAREARATNRLNKVRIQNHRNGLHKSPEESRKEEEFLEKLFNFMRERNTPIERVPHLGFKQINLYLFYTFAQNLGGYDKVTIKRLWKQIYDVLGGSPGSTSAATCTRRHYERLLLPYERYSRGEADKPLPPPSKLRRSGHQYLKSPTEASRAAPSSTAKRTSVSESDSTADVKTSPIRRQSPSPPVTPTAAAITAETKESPLAQPKTLKDDSKVPVSTDVMGAVSSTTTLAASVHVAPSSDSVQQQSPQPASPFVAPCVTPTLPSAEASTPVAEEANDGVPEAKIPSSGSQEWEEAQTRQLSLARKKLKEDRITEKEKQWEEIRRQNAIERDRVKQMGHGGRHGSSSRLSKMRDSLPQLSPVTPPDLTSMDTLSQPESGTHLRQAGSMDHSPPPHLEPQLPPPLPSPDPMSVAGKDGSELKRHLSPTLANSPSPTAQLPPPPPLVDLTRVVNTLHSSKFMEEKLGSPLTLLPLKYPETESPSSALPKNVRATSEKVFPDKNRHFEASYQQFLLSTAAAAYAEREQTYQPSAPSTNRDSNRHPVSSAPVVKTEAKWVPRPSSATAFSPWPTSNSRESTYSPKPLPEPARKLSAGAISNACSSNSCSPTLSLLARPSVIQHTPSASKSMSPSPSLSQRSSSASPSPRPSPSLGVTALSNYRPPITSHHQHSRTSHPNFIPSSSTVPSTATSTVGSFQYYQLYQHAHHPNSHVPPSHQPQSHLVSTTPDSYRDSAKKPRLDSPLFTSPQYYPAPKVFVQPQGYHGSPYVGQYYMPAPTYSAPSSSASCNDEVLDLSVKKVKQEKEDKSEDSAKTSSQGALPVQYVNPLPEYERVTPPEKELDLSLKSRNYEAPTADNSRYATNSIHNRTCHSSGLRNSGLHNSGHHPHHHHHHRYHNPGLQNTSPRNSISEKNHSFTSHRVPLAESKKDSPYPTTRVMASVVPIVQTDVMSKSASAAAGTAATMTVSSNRNRTPDLKNISSETKPEQVLTVSSAASDHTHSSKQPYYTTHYGSSPFYASSMYSVPPQFMSSPSNRQYMTSEQIQASITAYKDMYHQQQTQSLYGAHYPYAIASQLYPHLYKDGGQQYLYPPK